MLKILLPENHQPEREYTIERIFTEFLGIAYQKQVVQYQTDTFLNLGDKTIRFKDGFFSDLVDQDYRQASSIPASITYFYSDALLSEKDLPVLYGQPKLSIQDQDVLCEIDVFATIFFFLSRWEETVSHDIDVHERFTAKVSFASKHNLLLRPVVDEYLYFIQSLLDWLGIKEFKEHQFEINFTCDVDYPLNPIYYKSKKLVRQLGGDLLKRKSVKSFSRTLKQKIEISKNGIQYDPFYTFPYLMKACEDRGIQGSFYFIPGHSAGAIDGVYNLSDSVVCALLKEIDERGHEIGIHFSYNTYNSLETSRKELFHLSKTLLGLGIHQKVRGGRQHFLRWSMPSTACIWNELGLEYDSTLGYPDHIGFRCGTTRPFTLFDPIKKVTLSLIEKPLIMMEYSLIGAIYMNQGYSDEAKHSMLSLKAKVEKYKGVFTVLWHNSHFNNLEDFRFFNLLIE